MERKSFAGMHCSVAQCLEAVGEWWTLLIVRDAFLGRRRFEQFQASTGISRNVLSDRLARLVGQGIFSKVPYSEHPPRYEYRLTDKGRDLWPVITAMRQWGDTYAAPSGPPVELRHEACGHVCTAEIVCSACGRPLSASEVRVLRDDDAPVAASEQLVP